MTRYLLLALTLLLVGFTSLTLWMTRDMETPTAPVPGSETPAAGQALIGGAFTLTDSQGQAVSDSAFRGRLMLVFFGFTHCPDVCPLTLGRMSAVMEQLGESAGSVAPLLITVDPERDTPERLKEYLASFHPSIVGLTGAKEQIADVAKAYRVYYARQAPEEGHAAHGGDDYLMNHSGIIYLMGRQGEYLAHFPADASEQVMLETLRRHL